MKVAGVGGGWGVGGGGMQTVSVSDTTHIIPPTWNYLLIY